MSAQATNPIYYEQSEVARPFADDHAAQMSQVGLPEPIQALRDGGQLSQEEEALARRFFYEVHQSEILPQLSGMARAGGQPADPQALQMSNHVKGIFTLLNAIDEQLLGTVCALLLEMKLSGHDQPLPIAEVGRRIMGYPSEVANAAAGAALLRAALWVIRFGYRKPELCNNLLQEKRTTIHQDGKEDAAW